VTRTFGAGDLVRWTTVEVAHLRAGGRRAAFEACLVGWGRGVAIGADLTLRVRPGAGNRRDLVLLRAPERQRRAANREHGEQK
jgi:hypothetical protein